MEYKKHHYIPRSYLSAWTDPKTPAGQEPYVWLVNKESLEIRRRAPKNIMFENNLYTIEDEEGGRDLSLEKLLSMIEGEFVRVRDHVIATHTPLNQSHRYILLSFVSAMYSRTPVSTARLGSFWDELLSKVKAMSTWAVTANPEQRASAAVVTHPISGGRSYPVTVEQIQTIVDAPIPSTLVPSIKAGVDAMKILDITVLETTTSPGFITSDNPVVWFDPEGHKRKEPFQGPALIYPSIEISMAVSPRFSLLLHRRGINGYINLSSHGPLAEAQVVNEANWRVQIEAKDSLVVSQNTILQRWFDPFLLNAA